MAYLKGGTVVDGNLYVEGALKVKNLQSADGSIVALVSRWSGAQNYLSKFDSATGALQNTNLNEVVNSGAVTYTVINGFTNGNPNLDSGNNVIKASKVSLSNEASTVEIGYSIKLKGKKSDDTAIGSNEAPELVKYWSY